MDRLGNSASSDSRLCNSSQTPHSPGAFDWIVGRALHLAEPRRNGTIHGGHRATDVPKRSGVAIEDAVRRLANRAHLDWPHARVLEIASTGNPRLPKIVDPDSGTVLFESGRNVEPFSACHPRWVVYQGTIGRFAGLFAGEFDVVAWFDDPVGPGRADDVIDDAATMGSLCTDGGWLLRSAVGDGSRLHRERWRTALSVQRFEIVDQVHMTDVGWVLLFHKTGTRLAVRSPKRGRNESRRLLAAR